MPKKKIDQDIQSRIDISSKLDSNFFVEASAGSGKTTSLVFRMVALVESGIPVDKICTITFTKAAADEFFERFQKLLSIRSGDTPDKSGGDYYLGKRTDETKKRCREALNNIDSCFLGTMDSFCNTIAHELPSALKIPSNSQVISEDEFASIAKELFDGVLINKEHNLHNLAVRFNEAFSYKSFDSFAVGVRKLNEVRDSNIIYDASIIEEGFEKFFEKDRNDLFEIIKDLADVSISSEDIYINDILEPSDTEIKRVKAREKLQFAHKRIKRRIENKKPFDESEIVSLEFIIKDISRMEGFTENVVGTSIDEYVDEPTRRNSLYKYSDDFKERLDKISKSIEEYKYSLFFDFLTKFIKEITETYRILGKFTYFDFLLYLKKAFQESVENDPERVLLKHILERHEYFLIDESQDTSPLQTELFFYLTSTKNDKDWRKVEPKEGKLFIVGDPKQSIYSFRGADVLAYLENKKVFEKKNEVLMMTRNYRSNASLREWFNQTFKDMFNYQDENIKHLALEHLDIPIEPNDVTRNIPNKPDIVDGVYKIPVNLKEDSVTAFEPVKIARLIIDLVNNRKICVKKEKQNYSPRNGAITNIEDRFELVEKTIEFEDFLIVPLTTQVDKFIDAFNEYNIPFIVEGKTPYQDSKTLTTIVDILYLLKEPHNPNNLVKVLEGELFKFSSKDLIKMKNDGFNLDITEDSISALKGKYHLLIINKLNQLHLLTKEMSFSSTLLYLLNTPILDITKYISSEQLEYTFFVIEKIKSKEEDGSISNLIELRDYISDYSSLKGDEQRSLRFNKKVNKVKIANLHKVKGLEAPIVILANPKKSNRAPVRNIDYISKPQVSRFVSVADDSFTNLKIVETSKFESEAELWGKIAATENDRLAYVGATRARNVLIICYNQKPTPKSVNPWEKLLKNVGDDRIISASEEDIKPNTKKCVEIIEKNSEISGNSLEKSTIYRSPSEKSKVLHFNEDLVDELAKESKENRDAALKGTIVHKLMECLVTSNESNIQTLVDHIVIQYGALNYRDLLLEVARTMLSGGYEQKNSVLGKDLLGVLKEAKGVFTEVPFSYKANKKNSSNQNVIITGTIDLLYVDKNDNYHIIDYKTNDEDDVSVLEKEYEQQLLDYYYALKKNGITADYHIYHINLYNK